MDRKIARQFLETLFPEVPERSSILIWTLANKRSVFAANHEDALIAASTAKGDVYIGCCLAPVGLPDGRRATASQVTHMTALWADVDYAHPVHQKNHLPPDEKSAFSLIRKMPFKPSMIVHTGHGLQPWWLLKEAFVFEDDASRNAAASLSKAWNQLLQKHASTSGWSVDSTWDLARIMRLPGTSNRKGKSPRLVQIHTFAPDLSVTVDDIREFLPVETSEQNLLIAPLHESPQFVLKSNAEPPFGKFDAAMSNDDMFAETWNRLRKFESISEYDMSLASQLSAIGWTDQEIVDTLIAFRRKHHGKPKLRVDYYRMTMQKARREVDECEADERISELAALSQMNVAPEGMDDVPPQDARRTKALESLSQWFGFKVSAIEKTKSEEPLYSIKTEFGDTKIGPVSSIANQQKFRERVLDATGRWIKKKSKKLWDSYVQAIADACEDTDVGAEATDKGAITTWLKAYLNENPPTDLDIEGSTHDLGDPIRKTLDGERVLLICGPHFKTWLRQSPNGPAERINRKEFGVLMRAGGAYDRTVRLGGSTVNRWVLKWIRSAEHENEHPY